MGQFHKWNKHCKLCGVEFVSYRSDTEFCKPEHGKEYRYLKKSHPDVIQQLAGNSSDEDVKGSQIEEKPLPDVKVEYPPSRGVYQYAGKSVEGYFKKFNCPPEWKEALRTLEKDKLEYASCELDNGNQYFAFYFPNKKKPFEIWGRKKG